MTDGENQRQLEAVIGKVRAARDDTQHPLEATLKFREKAWRAYEGRTNASGQILRTRLVVAHSIEDNALVAHVDDIHWIVAFERLLALIDDVFATCAAISTPAPMFTPGHRFQAHRLHHAPGFRQFSQSGRSAPTPTLDQAAPVNALLAGFMAHAALRFIVDHEYFHAAHGHVLLAEALFDRPTLPELARLASPRERDMRLAMELEADRSAVSQLVLDTVAGDLPSNDAVAHLSPAQRLVLAVVAVAMLLGLFGAEQKVRGEPEGETHPVSLSRLHMLLQPGLARALRQAGLSPSDTDEVGAGVGRALYTLAELHAVFAQPLQSLDPEVAGGLDIDNLRLEMTYLADVAPHLAARHFSAAQSPPPP